MDSPPLHLAATALAVSAPAAAPGPAIDAFALVVGLLGGLAIFLFGLDQLAGSLRSMAGGRLKSVLARLTTNRLTGVLTGAVATAAIQSSSVTTVLLVGFVTAGLMTVAQSVGVIMGANIGSTITAQIIAFDVSRYALLPVAAGFALTFFGASGRTRRAGTALMGLGLVFFGMHLMGGAMAPLRSYPPFVEWMVRFEQPALGILTGALFTALIQSSAATAGVVIALGAQGLVSLAAGIALIFGANIGTCVTALLAAAGKPRSALRAAWVHVLFNTAGVVLWLPFLSPFTGLLADVFPDASVQRQIANAHTLFNSINTLVFLGFAGWFARAAERLAPDRPIDLDKSVHTRYLEDELLEAPSLALDRVRLEILHLGDYVRRMLQRILPAVLTGTRDEVEAVGRMDDAVDMLHGKVIAYLGRISQRSLGDAQTEEFLQLMEAVTDLENIGDIIETNLVALGLERIAEGVTISQATRQVIEDFHRCVSRALDDALQAVTQKSPEAARRVLAMKAEINRLADSAVLHRARRLVAAEPNRLPAYSVESDILQNLKRIYYFAKRMVRAAVPRTEGGSADAAAGGDDQPASR